MSKHDEKMTEVGGVGERERKIEDEGATSVQ